VGKVANKFICSKIYSNRTGSE